MILELSISGRGCFVKICGGEGFRWVAAAVYNTVLGFVSINAALEH
jgi:hypothetical protein